MHVNIRDWVGSVSLGMKKGRENLPGGAVAAAVQGEERARTEN